MSIKSRSEWARIAILLIPLLSLLLLIAFSCNYDHTTGTGSLYSLTTFSSPAGGGTVIAPDGKFGDGEQVEIEAVPAEGYRFDRWEDDHAGMENPDTLVFDRDLQVTAVFVPREYPLTVETRGEGRVREEIVLEKGKTDYEHGTRVQLTAEPESGWEFMRWEGDVDRQESGENPITLEINQPVTILAAFEQTEREEEEDDEDTDDGDEGDENDDGDNDDDGDDDDDGDEDDDGDNDDDGDDDDDGDEDDDGDDNDDGDNGEANRFTLEISVKGPNRVHREPDRDYYDEGEQVTLTAEANDKWRFVGWEGDLDGNRSPVTISMDDHKKIRAVFDREKGDDDDR